MKTIVIVVFIFICIGFMVAMWFILKPYFIKHDTTILFTGGLGSGKTLESVKRSIVLIRKNRITKYAWPNFKAKIKNKIRKLKNKLRAKHFLKLVNKGEIEKADKYRIKKPELKYLPIRRKPLLYSNIPIRFKTHIFGFKKEWSTQLDVQHILLLKQIEEYSVVMIDEFPAFISQFDWDIDLVQTNCNEFITFFRHYIGGHLIINAQSEDEIECHFRRKLNMGVWCYDFHIWPFPFLPLFYTNRMCDFMISENITTMSTTFVEDNTRIHFGLFPKKAYDSRCYSIRYDRVPTKVIQTKKWKNLKTNEVLRLRKYISPLDTATTKDQTDKMKLKAQTLERNKDNL